MSDSDVSSAVAAAIAGSWKKAKDLNQKLLAQNPGDIDCLNRLGKALLELGEKEKAITIFRKVLKINKYDSIAQKNLDRATASRKASLRKTSPLQGGQLMSKSLVINFLEEPGKTKLISLVNVASASTLLKLSYGDAIKLAPKRHTVVVTDRNDTYVGAIPDDLGHRLSVLVAAGNHYDGLVKSISKNSIVVLVREISRTKKFRNTPSFPTSNNDYFSFVREDTLHEDKPVITPTEADDDDAEDDSPSAHLHQDEEEAE